MSRCYLFAVMMSLMVSSALAENPAKPPAKKTISDELIDIQIPSAENKTQPIRYWVPKNNEQTASPLLVCLHSWSGNYKQSKTAWHVECEKRGWAIVLPNFQGPNFQPTACGSPLARQEILDALDYMLEKFNIDSNRIYLAGGSGGGHMTLLMASYYPQRFSAVSAWVPISDLAAWQKFCAPQDRIKKYAKNIIDCCGGLFGDSPTVDAQYEARSPIYHLSRVGNLPVDIGAGIHDGYTGSVPVDHSLNAFNVIAKAHGTKQIPQQVIESIVKNRKVPAEVSVADDADTLEKDYPRKIHLRRNSGLARVTIFEGGHESLPIAGAKWLDRHERETEQPQK